MGQDDIKAKIARSNAIGMGLIKPSDKLEEAGQEPKPEEQGLLLTPEEVDKIIYIWRCSLNEGRATEQLVELVAQAQLAKALKGKETEIEQAVKDERERIQREYEGE